MKLTRDDASGRYELDLGDGERAIALFRKQGEALAITHTEVPTHLEGRGHGSALMRAVMDDIRARGERARPLCSFARAWIRRHPDVADIVA